MNGLITDLMSHLLAAYESSNPSGTYEYAGGRRNFVEFARKYLDEHRTIETWPADSNLGIRLSNNVRLILHPGTGVESTGAMQDSGAVQITEGQSQPGQEGVIGDGSVRVI